MQRYASLLNGIPDGLPPVRCVGGEHVIRLKEGCDPISAKPFRMDPEKTEAMNVIVKELLTKGWIRMGLSSICGT